MRNVVLSVCLPAGCLLARSPLARRSPARATRTRRTTASPPLSSCPPSEQHIPSIDCLLLVWLLVVAFCLLRHSVSPDGESRLPSLSGRCAMPNPMSRSRARPGVEERCLFPNALGSLHVSLGTSPLPPVPLRVLLMLPNSSCLVPHALAVLCVALVCPLCLSL